MGTLSSFAFTIISAVILSRLLSKSEYGTYRQTLYVYHTLLVVFTLGLPRIFSYFLPRFNLNQGKDVVWSITKLLIGFGALFSFFLILFSGLISELLNNSDLKRGLVIFSPIPFFLLPTLGIEGIFASYNKTIYIAIYNIANRLFMLICIVLFVVLFEASYNYAILGWILSSFASFILAAYFKNIPFKGVIHEKANLSYKEIFSYSLPLVTASLWGIAIKAADQFYISRYFGKEVFAEFSNGFMGLPFVGMITGATSTVLMPLFSRLMHEKSDIENVINLWRNALIKSAIIIYPMVIFFLFNARPIMTILYGVSYINSAIYFQIAMLVNLFNIIVFTPLILSMGKTKFYSRLHMIFAFAVWALEYMAILIFNSPIAIAIISIIASISIVIVMLKYVSSLIDTKLIKLFPVVKLSIIACHCTCVMMIIYEAIGLVFQDLHDFLSVILNFIGYFILLVVSQRLFKLNYLSVVKVFTISRR